jgi:hypothetical protein
MWCMKVIRYQYYENEGEVLPRQIIIGEYSDADRSNKNDFGSNSTQVIEVVCEQNDAVRKYADEIGELVSNLIHPNTTSALLNGSDFSVMVVGKPSINYITENSGSGTKIVRLILRYSLLINEN